MTEKRFIFEQNGNFHTVIDTVEHKHMGVFEFKEDEFPVYACFHMIIDKMNELHEENKELQDTIETICKDFETAHGMNIRNTDWFTAW